MRGTVRPTPRGGYTMPTVTFEYRSEQERVAIERAVAFVSEMHSLAQTTPDGRVLRACEGHALDRSHGYCTDCRQPQFPADRLLGLDGWLTCRARGMADRAGIHDPFRQAE